VSDPAVGATATIVPDPSGGVPGGKPKRSRMRKARKYALDILYAADMSRQGIESAIAHYATMSRHLLPGYALSLARGVAANEYLIDGYLAPSLASEWTVDRMPVVDRLLARMATYEMVYGDLPASVAISEATGLAAELSTNDSPKFLNGVLARVATLIPTAEAAQDDGTPAVLPPANDQSEPGQSAKPPLDSAVAEELAGAKSLFDQLDDADPITDSSGDFADWDNFDDFDDFDDDHEAAAIADAMADFEADDASTGEPS
jgi:N utilization substance protein B